MAQSSIYETATEDVSTQGQGRRCKKAMKIDDPAQSIGQDNWLLNNPEALASLDRGLADAAAGRVFKRRSYAEYADIED